MKKTYCWSLILLVLLLCGCYHEEVFDVKSNFRAEVVNNNYSVPVLVKISNNTIGAEDYAWTMKGANPPSSTSRDPGTLQYDNPGTYIIHLEAGNQYGGKDSRDTTFIFDAAIRTAFVLSNSGSWYPDATVHITNNTVGATTYQWSFPGGIPSSSTQQSPGDVVFSTPGTYTISLKAGNGRVSYTKDTTVKVLSDLVNDFSVTWAAEDNDMEVPFTAYLQNNCVSATSLHWSMPGGLPGSSVATAPDVTYTVPGTYTVSLTAFNDKKSISRSKSFTLYANSNLYRFNNVHLGINTAQNTIGSCFSSLLGKVLKVDEINNTNGRDIDFVFFGFDSSFSINKFISPSDVMSYTFARVIPGAITTGIINRQESCGCGTSMTSTQFDAMTDDILLKSMTISTTSAGAAEFDNTVVPRIILFQTQDGRKGAIKVKQFVAAGQQSYIVCDIKVMKSA